jgi:hypothetical protein
MVLVRKKTKKKNHQISEYQSSKKCSSIYTTIVVVIDKFNMSSTKWSKSDSATILINNHKQILFHPRISSSTQVILADRPLPLNGKFYWEIFMPAVYGTSIMFGIASKLERIYTNKSNFYFS